MKKLFILFIVLFTYSFSLYAEEFPHTNESFSKAKKQMKQVYFDNQFTFYCNCIYDYKKEKGREKMVVYNDSCGYKPRKNKKRGETIEWEHINDAGETDTDSDVHDFFVSQEVKCPNCKKNNKILVKTKGKSSCDITAIEVISMQPEALS